MVRSPKACSGAGAGGVAMGVMNKGSWTEAEDEILSAHIKAHGEGNWRLISKLAGLSRCGKSCRLRWINYLRPDLKLGNFSLDEDNLILTLHALLGNRWSLIAGRIPGRTDNEIKNYWNTHLRRKLRSMGIDPMNYKVGLTLNITTSTSDNATDDNIKELPDHLQVNGTFVSSAPQNQNTIANSLQELHLPAQLVINSSPDSSTSTGSSDSESTRDTTTTTLLSQDSSAVAAGSSCGWEYNDQFRMEHLQLLDPGLEFSGMLHPLVESSSHVHNVDVQGALWKSTSGSLFDSLLD